MSHCKCSAELCQPLSCASRTAGWATVTILDRSCSKSFPTYQHESSLESPEIGIAMALPLTSFVAQLHEPLGSFEPSLESSSQALSLKPDMTRSQDEKSDKGLECQDLWKNTSHVLDRPRTNNHERLHRAFTCSNPDRSLSLGSSGFSGLRSEERCVSSPEARFGAPATTCCPTSSSRSSGHPNWEAPGDVTRARVGFGGRKMRRAS